MEVLTMDLNLRKPKIGYKHKPIYRKQISKDEFFIVIWIRDDGYAMTSYEDLGGCRYLCRRSRIQMTEDGLRFIVRDGVTYLLPDDI
jgi:hypothetical protein